MNINSIPAPFSKMLFPKVPELGQTFLCFVPTYITTDTSCRIFFLYLSFSQDCKLESRNCVSFIFANSVEPGPTGSELMDVE